MKEFRDFVADADERLNGRRPVKSAIKMCVFDAIVLAKKNPNAHEQESERHRPEKQTPSAEDHINPKLRHHYEVREEADLDENQKSHDQINDVGNFVMMSPACGDEVATLWAALRTYRRVFCERFGRC